MIIAPRQNKGDQSFSGSLRRLGRDISGNVLPMMAAAVFPVIAMIGGGVDATRAYMTQARLQQACDSGALATRRAMTGSTLTAANITEGTKFFDFNFPAASFGTTGLTRSFAAGTTSGTVVGTAAANVPATLMKLFNYTNIPLTVSCTSTLSVPNTDVMFVLDTSGSMSATISGDTQSKIAGLRQGVKDFYKALGPGTATGAGRIRYGFVPYNSGANVGKLVQASNSAYILGGTAGDVWNYQTRVPVTRNEWYVVSYSAETAPVTGTITETTPSFNSYVNLPTSGTTTVAGTAYTNRFTNITTATCSAKVVPPDVDTASGGTTGPTLVSQTTPTYPATLRVNSYNTTQNFNRVNYRYRWTLTSGSGASALGTCQLQNRSTSAVFTRTTPTTRNQTATWANRDVLTSWNYIQSSLNVYNVANNASATNPSYWSLTSDIASPNGNTGSTMSWTGCVEEANSDNTITASSSLSIPATAYDMQIDLIPSSAATKWKPHLPAVVYDRLNSNQWQNDSSWNSSGWAVCPSQASRLNAYTSDVDAVTGVSTSLASYVDGLAVLGGTQHDIGMIWGSRFLSQSGIFSAQNSDSTGPGGFPINRHIVFMTDGAMDARNQNYGPWGLAHLDGRQVPTSTLDIDDSSTAFNDIHYRRMEMICNAAKAKGYTIWVIGYGITTMPTSLQNCATDVDHWALASSSTALKAKFTQIAQSIGGLRLSQ